MHRISTLWKANAIVFISSFCVMVIELIAARILAPYIGVSLYTWTSIIGVILAGIALGNFLGGKIADRYPSHLVLVAIFFIGSLLTIFILPVTKMIADADWVAYLPLMLGFIIKASFIFFLPATILSMVSPLVIKLALADLGQTGGIVGTIYAVSTAGAILGTFLTGFYFILWFGTRTIVWLVAGALFLTGVLAWFSWKVPDRWRPSLRNYVLWIAALAVALAFFFVFQARDFWRVSYTRESNYYAINVENRAYNIKVLSLDRLVHSYVIPDNPAFLKYEYLQIFNELIRYTTQDNPAPRLLHLGGGGYSLPRYLEIVYPESVNEVVEIDPAVTQVAYQELGLPQDTTIVTFNQDARLFLMQRKAESKYDFVVGDVFNDLSTPYHLTTLEFARLVKANMEEDGIYMINIVDDYQKGRYLPAFLQTLSRAFGFVYLFSPSEDWQDVRLSTFVIAATDRRLDLTDYSRFVTRGGSVRPAGYPLKESEQQTYLAARNPMLLTDDHAPTDVLVAPLIRHR